MDDHSLVNGLLANAKEVLKLNAELREKSSCVVVVGLAGVTATNLSPACREPDRRAPRRGRHASSVSSAVFRGEGLDPRTPIFWDRNRQPIKAGTAPPRSQRFRRAVRYRRLPGRDDGILQSLKRHHAELPARETRDLKDTAVSSAARSMMSQRLP